MDFLTRFGIGKSRLTVLVMLGLILLGLMSYISLPKREDPEIVIRSSIVSVQFPGMPPERMEEVIVTPIERKAREIGEIEDINVLISTGSAVLNLSFYDSVSAEQVASVQQDIRNKMEDIKSSLPDGTKGPFVNSDYGDVSIATIAITGSGFSDSEIAQAAEDLQKSLYTIDGISKVKLYGEQKEQIWLEIDSRKLASLGVQLPQMINDLRDQNVIMPAGELDTGDVNLVLEANGNLGSVSEIENVLTKIKGLEGLIRLKDLMTVRRGYQDPISKPVFYNGEPAVMAAVEMSEGNDIQELGIRLKNAVSRFEQNQPIGISYRFSTYQEEKVSQSINSALMNVAQTLIVVFVVMLLFLGFRPALIIAGIVPFTVTFALIGMSYLGIQLEQVSIAAVIISLGLLVDNGLVVIEDIQGRMDKGASAVDAALQSGHQFMVPLGVASVTTVAAFLPILLLEGTEGEYAFSLGAVVGIMLLGSWLTALYILPALSVWFLKSKNKVDETNAPSWLIKIYGSSIKRSLPFAPVIIVLSYAAVAGSVTLFSSIEKEMFPLSERNQYLIYMDMPKGVSISSTKKHALAVEKWLSDKAVNPEVTDTTLYVGDGGPRFYLALSPADAIPSSAFFLINTEDFEGAVTAANRAQRFLAENHPEAKFKIKRLAMGGGESGIVEVKLEGSDGDILLDYAQRVQTAFAGAPGIVQNENDWGNKIVKIVVNIDQAKAREKGVTSKNISKTMELFYSGLTVSTLRQGDDSIPITMRAEEGFRNNIENLRSFSILSDGDVTSLDQIGSLDHKLDFYQIRRENQKRVIMVSVKSDVLAASKLLDFARPKIDEIEMAPGYSIGIGGETENSSEVNAKLAAGLPITLMVMLVALMFQFNSARRVLLTFMTIPLVLIGAPIALYFTSQPLSFFATLGMIALAGIIINNAIVLIDQIDIERQTQTLKDAVTIAAQKRITPILLTSLTTVFGLLPMAIAGGALWEPMAALMIGGLSVSSMISLFFVPSAYYLLFRFNASNNDNQTQTSS